MTLFNSRVRGHSSPFSLAVFFALSTLLSGCIDFEKDKDNGSSGSTSSDSGSAGAFHSKQSTARFLTQATFGPTPTDLKTLPLTSASDWFIEQTKKNPSTLMPGLEERIRRLEKAQKDTEFHPVLNGNTTYEFWENAVAGHDQLRQRMAWALSQIFVVSNAGGEELTDIPHAVTYYQDLLIKGAFGNYRDLLEQVTYSPAMGVYLTYAGNVKADPAKGNTPDENYAREVLQLFSVGLVALNKDGQAKLDAQGNPVEIYSNKDITGLAKVFTGLNLAEPQNEQEENELHGMWKRPMAIYEEDHSAKSKTFLGTTIPENTPAKQSIGLALDTIASHPNVAPFIGKQLIQRMVTSNPSPQYIERVSNAFDTGSFTLPNGASVGAGKSGDLLATLAAVLFDSEARATTNMADHFGKIREPVIRIANWARAFEVSNVKGEFIVELYETSESETIKQHPYRSDSVFNFYRPGYVAPNTQTGNAGYTLPEMQITHTTTIPGYIDLIFGLIDRDILVNDQEFLTEFLAELKEEGIADGFTDAQVQPGFIPNYQPLQAFQGNLNGLLDYLSDLLVSGQLSTENRSAIQSILNEANQRTDETPEDTFLMQSKLAIWLVMTSTDYLIQR